MGDAIYSLWSRELLETITLLMDRVGKYLDIPEILEEGVDISELWHAGAYQRQLHMFVDRGGNLAEDMLLPLVFFSGPCRICLQFWADSHDVLHVINVFFLLYFLVCVPRALA